MKTSAIIEIFEGRRGNSEMMWQTQTEADRSRKKTVEELRKGFSKEVAEQVRDFQIALNDDCCADLNRYYAEGFKLGLLIGIECMDTFKDGGDFVKFRQK